MSTLESLQAELAALLDPLDVPGEWTPRRRAAYEAKRTALQSRVTELQHQAEQYSRAERELADFEQQLAEAVRWRDFQRETWRPQLCGELLDRSTYPRTRAELDYQQNLKLSISSIDRGLQALAGASCYTLRSLRLADLMIEAGYTPTDNERHRIFGGLPWRGSLKEIEHEIVRLTKQRDAAVVALADASLSNEDRAARAAERNARPTRKTRGDGSVYERYADGRIVEISS